MDERSACTCRGVEWWISSCRSLAALAAASMNLCPAKSASVESSSETKLNKNRRAPLVDTKSPIVQTDVWWVSLVVSALVNAEVLDEK